MMGRIFKEEILAVLEEDYPEFLFKLLDNPPEKTVNVLFSAFLALDEKVRWHAIVGFGVVVKRLAVKSFEKARIVMRRCMWMLNDESGGIGWGVPEAMAEAMANYDRLFEEYHRIFLSYLFEREEGEDNFLEFLPLIRGAFWGLARLCNVYPESLKQLKIDFKLTQFMQCFDDPFIQVYIWLALKGIVGTGITLKPNINREIKVFWNNKFLLINPQNIGDLL